MTDDERLRDAGMVEYGELPELTRGLRALGSSRRGGTSQELFFNPLLDARRRAAASRSPEATLRAFDATDLRRALDKAIERIISEWPDARASVRRALRAELSHRVQPYTDALTTLTDRAADVIEADADAKLDRWRGWTTQLAMVFEIADRTWLVLRSVVDSLQKGRG